jgi:hypothetical protein
MARCATWPSRRASRLSLRRAQGASCRPMATCSAWRPTARSKIGTAQRAGRLILDGDVILPADGTTMNERRRISQRPDRVTVALDANGACAASRQSCSRAFRSKKIARTSSTKRATAAADAVKAAARTKPSLREAIRLSVRRTATELDRQEARGRRLGHPGVTSSSCCPSACSRATGRPRGCRGRRRARRRASASGRTAKWTTVVALILFGLYYANYVNGWIPVTSFDLTQGAAEHH